VIPEGIPREPALLRRHTWPGSSVGKAGWHLYSQPPPADVAAGTSESLNVLKKKEGEDSREGKPGGKCIKNSPYKLAGSLAVKTKSFI
jgi:hypothetical protein